MLIFRLLCMPCLRHPHPPINKIIEAIFDQLNRSPIIEPRIKLMNHTLELEYREETRGEGQQTDQRQRQRAQGYEGCVRGRYCLGTRALT